ncbi:hypothetical protein JOD63_002096 [Microbacterium terrae]|uniref:Uncharacterized protein n=1 Tax=Microbacterium terrae TaxID=69369 RepID=A0A0M2H669_9MICO|nr:DUF6350 family protein [Microbacterium terrae]KJL39536.1 hypothetical protein RS81_01953 [Microbacterium terrae]MBP1078128.1 hypothetical protein [Microbacterium terrae]GLJ97607.1 hypothetical protein GCM10017594_08040 [Microbacterium terrae]
MNRLLVAILSAVDATVAVAVGVAAVAAPLTVLWVFGFGGAADWGALWPASAVVWQLGDLVPFAVRLPDAYLAAAGIDPEAAAFTLSLAPLAFAAFTAIFAARSGVRASRAEGALTGVATGSAVVAVLAGLIAWTSANAVAQTPLWLAVLAPTLVYALPAAIAAFVTEWCEATRGSVARLRDRTESLPNAWGAVAPLVARGSAIVVAGLIGAAAVLTAAAILLRADEIIALYEVGNVDALGATVLTLGQLVYLPTLIVWALAFIAGPGFSLGAGSTVSPAGTSVGVVPGVPLLGVVPESLSPWLLLLALVPVGLGALAGWSLRSRLVRGGIAGHEDAAVGARAAITAGVAVVSAVAAAVLAWAASGSLGPGTLAAVGPDAGPVALAVALEVALGAGILLLSPLGHDGGHDHPVAPDTWRDSFDAAGEQVGDDPDGFAATPASRDQAHEEPDDASATAPLGPRRTDSPA